MELEHLIFSQAPQRVAPFLHAVSAGEYLIITGQMPTLKNDSTKLVGGKKIKQDVSGLGSFEIIECKISNIRETKEFSAQSEHIKKMFNKK